MNIFIKYIKYFDSGSKINCLPILIFNYNHHWTKKRQNDQGSQVFFPLIGICIIISWSNSWGLFSGCMKISRLFPYFLIKFYNSLSGKMSLIFHSSWEPWEQYSFLYPVMITTESLYFLNCLRHRYKNFPVCGSLISSCENSSALASIYDWSWIEWGETATIYKLLSIPLLAHLYIKV